MKPRHKKFAFIVTAVVGVSLAVLFILDALQSNVAFFHSPSDVFAGKAPTDRTFRLGGMVKQGSLKKNTDSLKIGFTITDYEKEIRVTYEGILPDLFREGQGVITQGRLQKDKTFIATEVLAKHDENYMPPEVAAALKKPGNDTPKSTRP